MTSPLPMDFVMSVDDFGDRLPRLKVKSSQRPKRTKELAAGCTSLV